MKTYHPNQFPGETEEYCSASNELLQAEIELRKQAEQVAKLRRELPQGDLLKENYIFEQGSIDLANQSSIK